MGPADNIDLNNERLVAYIDGELSASERESVAEALSRNSEVRERLAVLQHGGRPFDKAFDLLLNVAPEAKLQAMFADLVKEAPAGVDSTVVPLRMKPFRAKPVWQMAIAAVLLALVFLGGLYAGGYFSAPTGVSDQNLNWREAAARYVALFSIETLEYMPTDPQQREANLERAQMALGLPLTREKITAPALEFQGTQLLQLKGRPIAQIAYLYDGHIPVALCIIRAVKPTQPPETETRHGLNIVHWIKNGYGFMVIGDVPDADLAEIAKTFEAHFS